MNTLGINLDAIVIRPITNQAEFNKANEIINSLIDADLLEDSEVKEKALSILEAVSVLAIDYEKKNFPITKLDPIEAIKQRMEMLNISQKDMAKYFGGANRVSEVLNRKRPLTLKIVKNLYHGLGIAPEILLA